MRYFLCFSDEKAKWIDPKVIKLNDNSEPKEDVDYIPDSPPPDETFYRPSSAETRWANIMSHSY